MPRRRPQRAPRRPPRQPVPLRLGTQAFSGFGVCCSLPTLSRFGCFECESGMGGPVWICGVLLHDDPDDASFIWNTWRAVDFKHVCAHVPTPGRLGFRQQGDVKSSLCVCQTYILNKTYFALRVPAAPTNRLLPHSPHSRCWGSGASAPKSASFCADSEANFFLSQKLSLPLLPQPMTRPSQPRLMGLLQA